MGSRKKAGPPPPMNLNMNVGKQHPSLTGWAPHQSLPNPGQPPKSQKQKEAVAIAMAKKKGSKSGGY